MSIHILLIASISFNAHGDPRMTISDAERNPSIIRFTTLILALLIKTQSSYFEIGANTGDYYKRDYTTGKIPDKL
jgi:hypothetical protein